MCTTCILKARMFSRPAPFLGAGNGVPALA